MVKTRKSSHADMNTSASPPPAPGCPEITPEEGTVCSMKPQQPQQAEPEVGTCKRLAAHTQASAPLTKQTVSLYRKELRQGYRMVSAVKWKGKGKTRPTPDLSQAQIDHRRRTIAAYEDSHPKSRTKHQGFRCGPSRCDDTMLPQTSPPQKQT